MGRLRRRSSRDFSLLREWERDCCEQGRKPWLFAKRCQVVLGVTMVRKTGGMVARALHRTSVTGEEEEQEQGGIKLTVEATVVAVARRITEEKGTVGAEALVAAVERNRVFWVKC